MKNFIRFVALLFIIFMFLQISSCGSVTPPRNFYTYNSSSIGNIKTHTAKPVFNDVNEKTLYISGNYSEGRQYQNKRKSYDTKKTGTLSLHQSHTSKWHNYYYGLGASYGKYTFNNTLNNFVTYGEEKDFYSVDIKSGYNFNLPTKHIDFRPLGIEFTYNYANGSYQKKLDNIPFGNVDPGYYFITIANEKSIFSFNLNKEIVIKLPHKNNFTMGVFYGEFFQNESTKYHGAILSLTYNKFTFSTVWETYNGTVDETEMSNFKFGITYRLNTQKKKIIKKKRKPKTISSF